LAAALKNNHTLMGIHVEGNNGFIDSKGFLIPSAKVSANDTGSSVFSRILASQLPEIKNKENWTATSNCWICERWQEYTFTFDPVNSTMLMASPLLPELVLSVTVCTNFDKWIPLSMEKNPDTNLFELVAMVPPGKNQFAFVVNEYHVCAASDQELAKKLPSFGHVDESKSVLNLPKLVNNLTIEVPNEFNPDGSLAPRTKGKKMPKGKRKWEKSSGWWNGIQLENVHTWNNAFITDLANTRIEKTICKKNRNDEDVLDFELTKRVLLDNYGHIKQVFRNYAATVGSGSEIFAMGKNGFYEFLNANNLIAVDKGQKTDISSSGKEDEPQRRRRGSKDNFIVYDNCGEENIGNDGLLEDLTEEELAARDDVIANQKQAQANFESYAEGIGRAEVGLMFVACQTVGPKASFNKKNSLTRFQFLEVCVLLAIERYKGVKGVKVAEAVQAFVSKVIMPESDLNAMTNFREEIIFTEKIDSIFKRNMGVFEGLFAKYSGKTNLPGQKKTTSYLEWQQLFTDSKLVDEGFLDRNIKLTFVKSLQLAISELNEKERRSMEITEMMIGVVWTAAVMGHLDGGYVSNSDELCANVQMLINTFVQYCLGSNRK